MKIKHPNGIELYQGKAGNAKGKWRARLWNNGRILAESGEAYVKRSRANAWGASVRRVLITIGA